MVSTGAKTRRSVLKKRAVKWPLGAPRWTPFYIEWDDAVDHSDDGATWQSLEGPDKMPADSDGKIWQCGLLYAITDSHLTVVFATDKTQQVLKPFQIPRTAITKLRRMSL